MKKDYTKFENAGLADGEGELFFFYEWASGSAFSRGRVDGLVGSVCHISKRTRV